MGEKKLAAIVSLNIGMPQDAEYQGRTVSTGIYKMPAAGPVRLTKLNFEGDGQADLVNHGGPDKAVCVYPHEHYAFWSRELGRELPFGAFGENMTVSGLPEESVCIGDVFRAGEAVVQISQPRQPCFKLAMKHGKPDMALLVQDRGFTGYYFRVLQEGTLHVTDRLEKLSSHPKAVSVAFANRIMHHDKTSAEGIARLLDVEELSASWQATLRKRLNGIEPDTRNRLEGSGSAG